ncbi:MAG: hypothetical protein A2Z73_03735 [Deltaproteobacteria bacterium RBG_13_60_28]|nr:MAG: hypothetical protein A2Z73_03735 [Deltaproteobacteria bacterium RBG_13_60_28]
MFLLALWRLKKFYLVRLYVLCVLVVKFLTLSSPQRQTMADMDGSEKLRAHFARVKGIIQAEEMWERVPDYARDFSPENLENLVKFAYFGGFIDMAQARGLLLLEKEQIRVLRTQWYEEVREKGCWLC